MKLLLDIGNTRIKWAFELADGLSAAGEFVHRDKPVEEIARFVEELNQTPQAAFAVNVAGDVIGAQVAAALEQQFNCELHFMQTSTEFAGVKNGYSQPEQLGVDRWAALVCAWKKSGTAVCVVDAGSATTVDLVARSGQHFGGIILPGLTLMQSVLKSDTSDIETFASRGITLPDAREWYGRNTAAAVQKGSVFATVKTIESAIASFPEAEVEPRLFLTGGDAPLLQENLSIPAEYHPSLVLEGLGLLSKDVN